MNRILVTGATGVIGSALVPELLKTATTEVTLLIRADSEQHLRKRAGSLLTFLGVDTDEIGQRIQVVRGDVTQPLMGIEERTYAELAAASTHVVHSAGVVKLNQPLEAARRNFVVAAQHVLDFARSTPHLKKLDVVSTIGVAGCMEGVVPETRLTAPRQFHNTYEQAKAETEELFWQAIEAGMPITIHRPSMVVGDSKTGFISKYYDFYHLCDFLAGRRTAGVLPRLGPRMLDIVPVDYVVRCLAAAMFSEQAKGRVFHLCSGHSEALKLQNLRRSVRRIYTQLGKACPRGVAVPRAMFAALVWAAGKVGPVSMRGAAKAAPYFLPYLGREQIFDSTVTQRWLEPLNIHLPEPNDYLQRVLERYLCRTPSLNA